MAYSRKESKNRTRISIAKHNVEEKKEFLYLGSQIATVDGKSLKISNKEQHRETKVWIKKDYYKKGQFRE